MPYYKDKKILFIHIPKTGGTKVEQEISKYTSQTLYSRRTNTLLDSNYKNISLQHQFFNTL